MNVLEVGVEGGDHVAPQLAESQQAGGVCRDGWFSLGRGPWQVAKVPVAGTTPKCVRTALNRFRPVSTREKKCMNLERVWGKSGRIASPLSVPQSERKFTAWPEKLCMPLVG